MAAFMADHESKHESLLHRTKDKFHDHDHESKHESLLHRVKDKFHDHKSSSSDSDDDRKVYRIFGREKPVHKVLGGGQLADILLWRNKKASAIVLGGATVFWFLFEFMGYHLITLACHILIVSLATLFLWSNAHVFINKAPPQIPDAAIPEKCVLQLASALTIEINQALVVLRETASGKNLLKFLGVIAGLWVFSVIGNWCNFLTLVYICTLLVFVLPFLYEKYDDRVDAYAEKAMVEIKKKYAVLEANVLSKISVGPLKKD